MNRAEKEQYLREYEVLKKKGKPFFPYAIMKDSTMALDRRARDRRHVDRARRRAGPEGGPDHDHLRAAARVVLLLPLRGAARAEAARTWCRSRRSASRRRAWSCCCSCRSTTAGRSAARSAGPVAMTAMVLTIIAMAFLTYDGRDTDRARRRRRSATSAAPRRHVREPGQGRSPRRAAAWPATRSARTATRARVRPDPDRRPHPARRRSCARWTPARGSCPPSRACRRRSSSARRLPGVAELRRSRDRQPAGTRPHARERPSSPPR